MNQIFEEKRKSGGHRVDQSLFVASLLLTAWCGYKLYKGGKISEIVTTEVLDGGSDFVGVIFKNGRRVAYELVP